MLRTTRSRFSALRSSLAAGLLAGSLALAGCTQGEGDRCEVDSDCSGDLRCSSGGTCIRGVEVKLDAAVGGTSGTTDALAPADGPSSSLDTAAADGAAAEPDSALAPDLAAPTPDAAVRTDVSPDLSPRVDAVVGN